MMNKFLKLFFIFSIMSGILFSSCKNDDPAVINDEEAITDVVVTLVGGGSSSSYTFNGTGQTIKMLPGVTYSVQVQFWNKSNPANPINITDEIITEKEEHFLTYAWTVNPFTFARDTDDITRSTGEKIGLYTLWSTVSTMGGQMQIALYHKPTTVNATANNNGGTVSAGEIDALATFPIEVAAR